MLNQRPSHSFHFTSRRTGVSSSASPASMVSSIGAGCSGGGGVAVCACAEDTPVTPPTNNAISQTRAATVPLIPPSSLPCPRASFDGDRSIGVEHLLDLRRLARLEQR